MRLEIANPFCGATMLQEFARDTAFSDPVEGVERAIRNVYCFLLGADAIWAATVCSASAVTGANRASRSVNSDAGSHWRGSRSLTEFISSWSIEQPSEVVLGEVIAPFSQSGRHVGLVQAMRIRKVIRRTRGVSVR